MIIMVNNETASVPDNQSDAALVALLPFLYEDSAVCLYRALKCCSYGEAVDWVRIHKTPKEGA